MANGRQQSWKVTLLILGVSLVARMMFAAFLPLFPDETYYWEWTRHLAAGYFDHPPAIAVLIAAGTHLGTDPTRFLIRLFPVIAGGVAALFATLLARDIAGLGAARAAAWIFSVMPLAATGLVLATPDAPLLATTAAATFCIVRAVRSSSRPMLWWIAAGAALGLAFTSKYTSILLPVTTLAALLIRPGLRAHLRTAGPYVAAAVATFVFLPVLMWNAQHDWISFRFQLAHGLGVTKGSPLKRELDLVGGQIGLVSPILFVLTMSALWHTLRAKADDARFLLATIALGSWMFFVYSALRKSVEANWPAPAYIAAVPLLCALSIHESWRKWTSRGVVLSALMTAVIYLHAITPVLPLKARKDPTARNIGWNNLALAVAREQQSLGNASVAADRYQDVSELSYYLPGHPQAFCTCLSGRRNQYDLWPGFAQIVKPGSNLVIVAEDTSATAGSPNKLAAHFSSVTSGGLVALARGSDTIVVRRLWILRNYRGGWPATESAR